jgi:hypothetical protein
MRRLAGILLTVATVAAVLFTFTTEDAGAIRTAVRHPAGTTKADRHLCASLDHLVRFLRHAPKPSALRSKEGKRVLAALDSGQPKTVAEDLHRIVWTFSKMRDGGVKAVTKRQDAAASAALFHVSVYAAPRCTQKAVRAFAGAMIQQRINQSESATSSTTRP